MSEDQSKVEETKPSQPADEMEEKSYSATRWVITGVLWVLVAIPAVASIIGFTGGSWWMNTLSNFRLQYIFLFAILLVLVAVLRRWVLAVLCLILVVANFVEVMPAFNSNVVEPAPQAVQMKIVLMNVAHKYNQDEFKPAADLLKAEQPDVVLVQECSDGWLGKFYDFVRDDYDIVTQQPRPDHYGIAMLVRRAEIDGMRQPTIEVKSSKTEKANGHIAPSAESDHILLHIPQIEAVIRPRGSQQWIYFYGIRTRPPMSKQRCDATEFIINKAIARVNDEEYRDMPKIILGDMNHTVWSPYIKKLMTETGTTPNSGAYGLQPTWYSGLPFPLRIPIDMVLLSDDMNLYECRVGPDIGSTHFPLIITVGPGAHMQKKTKSGLSGMLQSAENFVEDQADSLKDAASERSMGNE